MITFSKKGDWSKTNSFLERSLNILKLGELDKYGQEGVRILSENTPKDSGKTSESWKYQIVRLDGSTKIEWLNSNINDGVPIAILLQYGHALQNGIFLEGKDYINPNMKPLFDDIVENLRKELSK